MRFNASWKLERHCSSDNEFYGSPQSINQSINLFAQKHDRVKVKTKQSEQESKDTDATNSCPPVD